MRNPHRNADGQLPAHLDRRKEVAFNCYLNAGHTTSDNTVFQQRMGKPKVKFFPGKSLVILWEDDRPADSPYNAEYGDKAVLCLVDAFDYADALDPSRCQVVGTLFDTEVRAGVDNFVGELTLDSGEVVPVRFMPLDEKDAPNPRSGLLWLPQAAYDDLCKQGQGPYANLASRDPLKKAPPVATPATDADIPF